MVYTIRFKPSAVRALGRVPKENQRRIALKIEALAGNPRPHGVEKLRSEDNLYRVRIGDYRGIYQIQQEVLLILVVRIGHKREVYRDLK